MNLSDLVRKLQTDIRELTKLVLNIRASGGGGVGPHNILSVTHPDATAAAVLRGALITGQDAAPSWKRLSIGAAGYLLRSDGVDIGWDDISGVGGAPDDAEYIVGAANADLLNERVKQALYINYDPDDYPAAPNALDDEFDDGSIDVKWTIVNDPGLTEAPLAGFLYTSSIQGIISASAFANHVRLFQAPPAGAVTWSIAAKVCVAGQTFGTAAYMGAGVYLADTVPANDTFVGANCQISAGDVSGRMNVQGLMDNGAGILANMTSYEAHYMDQTSWIYIMLAKATANAYTAANTYNAYFSFNGITYTLMSSCSKTFANEPAEIGLWFRKPDGITMYARAIVDWFRRIT